MVSATAPDPQGEVEMISTWVAPFARGCGVADLLVEGVKEWAYAQTALAVRLSVMESNDRARAFYRRQHFEDAGRIETPGEASEIRMVLRLP